MNSEVDDLIPMDKSRIDPVAEMFTRAFWNYPVSVFAYPEEKVGGGYFLLLAGLPPELLKASDQHAIKREVTLVIDRSGSMRNEKIAQVKEAALQIIAGLGKGEAFNIIIYNNTVQRFAAKPVIKTAETEAAARAYVEGRKGPLGFADVDAIGRGQKAGEDAILAQAGGLGVPLVFLDTDLVSTMAYSRHYYGDCPKWIERDARGRRGDLYLLHHVDVDWVADGPQRAEPERREELLALFEATLEELKAHTAVVRGSWDERRRRAVESVDRLLA